MRAKNDGLERGAVIGCWSQLLLILQWLIENWELGLSKGARCMLMTVFTTCFQKQKQTKGGEEEKRKCSSFLI